MKRFFVPILAALAAVVLFGLLVHFVLVAAQVSQPATNTVYGFTARRIWATSVIVLALASVVIGGLALARRAGRLGSIVALASGLIAAVNGGLVLALATGGPGSGNGVVGGAMALVLGLIGMSLGALAATRSHRTTTN